MDNLIFSERLRQERLKRQLTQRDLADLCSFDTAQVSRYESAQREPSANALARIAEVLNLSIDYLMGLSDDPRGLIAGSDLSPHDRELLDVFHREGWPGVFRLGAQQMEK